MSKRKVDIVTLDLLAMIKDCILPKGYKVTLLASSPTDPDKWIFIGDLSVDEAQAVVTKAYLSEVSREVVK